MPASPGVVESPTHNENEAPSESGSATPVPETRLSRVNSLSNDEAPGVRAHRRQPSDAQPDTTETVTDSPGKLPNFWSCQTLTRSEETTSSPTSTHRSHTRRRSTLKKDQHGEMAPAEEPMDDFDDFAEGQETMEDDFGDFDDGFQGSEEAAEETTEPAQQPPSQSIVSPPIPSLHISC